MSLDNFNDLKVAIIEIQKALGNNPSGAYSSTRSRLDILEGRINNPNLPSPTVQNPFIIGNDGVSISTGVGAPTENKVDGSIYLRTDAISGESIYVRTEGVWSLVSGSGSNATGDGYFSSIKISKDNVLFNGINKFNVIATTTSNTSTPAITLSCPLHSGMEISASAIVRDNDSSIGGGHIGKMSSVKKIGYFYRDNSTTKQSGNVITQSNDNGIANAYNMTFSIDSNNIVLNLIGEDRPSNWNIDLQTQIIEYNAPFVDWVYYPDLDNLAAHFDFTKIENLFSDAAGTIPAVVDGRIRYAKGIDKNNYDIIAKNVTSDITAPYLRSDGASFGEGLSATHLSIQNIDLTNPYTIYVYCQRNSGLVPCLLICDSIDELNTWLNSFSNSEGGPAFLLKQGNGTIVSVSDTQIWATRGGSFDGNASVAFVNGVESNMNTTAGPMVPRIGSINNTYPYTGKIKHVLIYHGFHDLTKRNLTRTFISDVLSGKPIFPLTTAPIEIEVVIGFHWEGSASLISNDSAAIAYADMRAAYPDMKITQFINANYYEVMSPSTVTAFINNVVQPQDEIGLHIHPWYSLVNAAGVTSRLHPTYYGALSDSAYAGYDVILTAYTQSEMATIVNYSLNKLEANGFTRPISFVAGGWLSDSSTREALRSQGILNDSSAVPDSIINPAGFPGYLVDLLNAENVGITTTSQPYNFSTTSGIIREIPSQGAVCDYAADSVYTDLYLANVTEKLLHPNKRQRVFLSAHWGTVSGISRMKRVLDFIKAHALANNITLKWVTVAEAGS